MGSLQAGIDERELTTVIDPVAAVDFDEWYRGEYHAVVALVYTLSGSRWASEELTQDAFMEAHRRWASISEYDDPGAWVRKVAMNKARSRLRRRGAEVRSLPRQQAKVIALHYLDDRPVDEIARILGISTGTVKTHLHRARATRLEVPPDTRRSGLNPVLRFGAVGALAAGLIFVSLIFPSRGPTPASVGAAHQDGSSAGRSLPYFEPDVPDGWHISQVSENQEQMFGQVNMTLAYGAGSATEPFADAGIVLSFFGATNPDFPATFSPDKDREVLVRGHRGEYSDPNDGLVRLSWEERHDLLIWLWSRNYDVNDLVKIAEGITVDGFNVELPNPPDGMALVSSDGISESDLASAAETPHRTSWHLTIASDTDPRKIISVSTFSSHGGPIDVIRYFNPGVVDVEVRGTTGVLESFDDAYDPETPPTSAGALHWTEDGQAFQLTVIGPEDPVAVANSLHRIDESRFEELLASFAAPPIMPTTTTAPDPEGTRSPGTTIALP